MKLAELVEGLKKNWKAKLAAAVLIVLVASPVYNAFFAPSFNGGAASGQGYWINIANWGFHPFMFLGLFENHEGCLSDVTSSGACSRNFYSLEYFAFSYDFSQPGWEISGFYPEFFASLGSSEICFLASAALNFLAALIVSAAAFWAYKKIARR